MTVREGPIDLPKQEQYSDAPIFNTKAVVQQTGVPAPTLRAWERRYTLLSPERANNAYRLYSERDIAMIRWLKERVDEGIAISQAIALFRHMYEEQQAAQEKQATNKPAESEFQQGRAEGPPGFQMATPAEQQEPNGLEKLKKEQQSETTAHDWPELRLGDEFTSMKEPTSGFPTIHNMRSARGRLQKAFQSFDEAAAHVTLASMLAIYPVEQVCTELIAPTMWQIGQLWVEGQITVSVEHFASNFFRGLLSNLYHVTPSIDTGPLVIVCSAPGEPHELAPLMLALFLRRSGVRVAYLGQSIETLGLLQTIRTMAPALLCISLTVPTYLSALIDLGHQVQEQPEPRPIFTFGGQVFAHYPNVITQIPGIYLNGDLQAIINQLRGMLQSRAENKN